MAKDIEQSEEKRGRKKKTAARIAWATVNKVTGGARGKKKTRKKKSSVR